MTQPSDSRLPTTVQLQNEKYLQSQPGLQDAKDRAPVMISPHSVHITPYCILYQVEMTLVTPTVPGSLINA